MIKYILAMVLCSSFIGCAKDDCRGDVVSTTITDVIINKKLADNNANKGKKVWYWCEVETSFYGAKSSNAVPIVNLAAHGTGSTGVGNWVLVTLQTATLEELLNPYTMDPWRSAGIRQFTKNVSDIKFVIVGTPSCYRVDEVQQEQDSWRRCIDYEPNSPVSSTGGAVDPLPAGGVGASGGG